jgi:hypothetical protein
MLRAMRHVQGTAIAFSWKKEKTLENHENSCHSRMASSGMLRRIALVRSDVSEEISVSFIRVTRFGELGTTLVVTSKFLRNVGSYKSHTA